MAEHNDFGKLGEERAQVYLRKNGYIIRHTNWKYDRKELDIVAEKDDMLIVVEVKSRSTDVFEHPKDAITNAKIKNIVRAANEYIHAYDINKETRFDVITILPRGDSFEIEHIEDAFLPPVNCR